jgi:beta-glucuronidase
MRERHDLSGTWHGTLTLDASIDVDAPAVIQQPFYMPLPWNLQIDHLRWPGSDAPISGVVRPIQNQNFRDVHRKFNEGVIVYRRSLHLPQRDGRAYLCFEGANYHTTVRVNNQLVGEHAGGHLAFEFDITAAIEPGGNDIEITVDNRRRRDAAPQEQFNWQNYGGVYRPVAIEWRPDVHVQHVRVTPGRDAQGWYADVRVTLNSAAETTVAVTLRSGREVQSIQLDGATGTCDGTVRFDAPLVWQVGSGGMSVAEVTLVRDGIAVDRRDVPFGMRTVAIDGTQIVINGQSVRILGAAMHEQHAAFGPSLPPWQATRDLQLMKYVGLNTIRTAHYPHAQSHYEAADRMGMLAIAELPCWQFNEWHFKNDAMREHCVDYAQQMVAQLGNHPSIVAWLVQNESHTFEDGARPFFKAVADAFKSADPSRVTMSAESPKPPQHLAVVKEVEGKPSTALPPTHDVVDVLGVNNYAGWYSEKAAYFPQLLDHVTKLCEGTPVVVTEFGGEGILGERSLAMHPWTEDYQSELICHHIRAVMDRPAIAGFVLWLFADYECASIGIRGINAKGLVDEHRRPKLAFNAVRDLLARYRDQVGT